MQIEEARGIAAKIWCEPNHRRKVMDPTLLESIAHLLVDQSGLAAAKKTVSDALKQDDDLRRGYRANIAILLYDDQNGEHPANLATVADCNVVADAIIQRVFHHEVVS